MGRLRHVCECSPQRSIADSHIVLVQRHKIDCFTTPVEPKTNMSRFCFFVGLLPWRIYRLRGQWNAEDKAVLSTRIHRLISYETSLAAAKVSRLQSDPRRSRVHFRNPARTIIERLAEGNTIDTSSIMILSFADEDRVFRVP